MCEGVGWSDASRNQILMMLSFFFFFSLFLHISSFEFFSLFSLISIHSLTSLHPKRATRRLNPLEEQIKNVSDYVCLTDISVPKTKSSFLFSLLSWILAFICENDRTAQLILSSFPFPYSVTTTSLLYLLQLLLFHPSSIHPHNSILLKIRSIYEFGLISTFRSHLSFSLLKMIPRVSSSLSPSIQR